MKDHPVSPNILSYWKWVCNRDLGVGGGGVWVGTEVGGAFLFTLNRD